jgi:hypothetical protein
MHPTHAILYDRLVRFPIDDGEPAQRFEDRLAEEQRWSSDFARRTTAEYRRFLLLAATAAEPVTPSQIIDEAWHLHLTYTRSYWDRLCGEVLGKPLHHDPARGGPDEATKFRHQYDRTLAAYRTVFGEEPPADVWPQAGVLSRSERRQSPFAPRKDAPEQQATDRRWRILRTVAAVVAVVACAGCGLVDGGVLWLVVVALLVVGFGLVMFLRQCAQELGPRKRRSGGGESAGGWTGWFGGCGGGDGGTSGCGTSNGCGDGGGSGCGGGGGAGCGGGGCGGGGS